MIFISRCLVKEVNDLKVSSKIYFDTVAKKTLLRFDETLNVLSKKIKLRNADQKSSF